MVTTQSLTDEQLNVYLFQEKKENKNIFEYGVTFQYSIPYYFETKYGSPEVDELRWTRKEGLISKIKEDLGIPIHTKTSMM